MLTYCYYCPPLSFRIAPDASLKRDGNVLSHYELKKPIDDRIPLVKSDVTTDHDVDQDTSVDFSGFDLKMAVRSAITHKTSSHAHKHTVHYHQ